MPTTTVTYPSDQSNSTPSTSSPSTSAATQKLIDGTIFTISDPVSNKSAKTVALNQPDNIFFYSRTLMGNSFNLPKDQAGSINSNVMWGVYFDKGAWQPITGVKYFDFSYNPLNKSLDLIFWSNVNYKDINVLGKEDLYNSVRPALLSNGDIDPNSQRVVFITKGFYRLVNCDRTGTMTATGMFLFTKPALLLNPGPKNGDLADPVIDESLNYGFIEYQA